MDEEGEVDEEGDECSSESDVDLGGGGQFHVYGSFFTMHTVVSIGRVSPTAIHRSAACLPVTSPGVNQSAASDRQ